MTDIGEVAQHLREFEKNAGDRFHEHGKHISRIEGIFEERTRALAEADHDQRANIAAMGKRMDKVEERLTLKIEGIGEKVDAKVEEVKGEITVLGKDVVKQGVKLAIYVAIAGSVGVVALNLVVRELFG